MQKAVHQVLSGVYQFENRKFRAALQDPQRAQEKVLQESLFHSRNTRFWGERLNSIQNYSQFLKKIPVTHFADYREQINNNSIREDNLWKRWEPTSGSTQARKWIPYNQAFLNQLHRASYPWLASLYEKYPGIKGGTHYWSLSWLPEELRKYAGTDDSELFPLWQRFFLKQIFPIPSYLTRLTSQRAFWFATLVFLAAQKDLRLISVWSPTFLYQVVQDIQKYSSEIQATLRHGHWALFEEELHKVRTPQRSGWQSQGSYFLKELWPQLSLISCWSSSTSKSFADQIGEMFPDVPLQGKGLWATEGVVTVPYGNQYPLAVNSHFYEFRDLDNDRILTIEKLKTGMHIQPLLTSANGFLRYELDDILQVQDFLGNTPSLHFLGRKRGVDLVGEKMDDFLALQILNRMRLHFQGQFYSLKACLHPKPHYRLICTSETPGPVLEKYLEKFLLEIHHYSLARELRQLDCSQVDNHLNHEDAMKELFKSSIAGQNKIEPLIMASP